MIRTESLTMRFGGITALKNVSLEVREGELFSIIGPNGSGKSTLFNVITGIYKPVLGKVFLGDHNVTGKSPTYLNTHGVSRTFQNLQLFKSMSVLENILVAAGPRSPYPLWMEVLSRKTAGKVRKAMEESSFEVLEMVDLEKKAHLLANALPFGDQKRLEIARALATKPKVLMLDEPVAGLDPSERSEMNLLIAQLRKTGLTIILIEHDMRMVMGISERVMVLHQGEKIAEGTPQEVKAIPAVVAAYLGEEQQNGKGKNAGD
jgi:branched-chain amino acid transport system ATP-binding protein